jgi:D-beta-D-heptose 7-phosphate kinase/D-beta-D-heptose 1-phosphate adenosyltransferase
MLRQLTKKINVHRLLQRFATTTILVLGDIMIDEFIWGTVSRISPEAPVPVVAVTDDTRLLGGAANVVHNVQSLGGQILLAGVIGDDPEGVVLTDLLRRKGIPLDGVITEAGRPTTVKTRIIAHSQQVVRFDREEVTAIDAHSRERLLAYIRGHWDEFEAIIISDYGKGVITPEIMHSLADRAKNDGKVVAVDPKMSNFDLYRGVTLVTPNSMEAEAVAGKSIGDEASLLDMGRLLLRRFSSKAVLVTRGEKGMVLFEDDGTITRVPTVAKEVFDVTGAGDTVISTMALALAAGSDFPQAAVLANYAAGIVVGKVGTATVTPEELKHVIAEHAHA